MSETQKQNSCAADPMSELESRWEQVQACRPRLAVALKRLANQVGGEEAQQLHRISNWFGSDENLESAIQRPDVLAIAMPLINDADSQEFSDQVISRIANNSLSLVTVNSSFSRRALRILRYPLLVTAAFGLLWLCFTIWLTPALRETAEIFEVQLPLFAQAGLGITPALHVISWIFAAIIVAICIAVFFRHQRDKQKAQNFGWLDQKLTSTRSSVGIWSWHVALLLQSGLDSLRAVETAGMASGNHWVRSECQNWIEKSQSVEAEDELDALTLFVNSPFQLVSSTLQLPDSDYKTARLHQAARYYLERDRRVTDWWLHLLASLILWNVGVICLLLFLALYGAMFSLFQGLVYW